MNFINFTQGGEYEALLRGLQYLKEAKAISVEIFWRFRVSYKAIEWPI
jgi:hypothetical protein